MKKIIYLAILCFVSSHLTAQSTAESKKIQDKQAVFTKEGGIIKTGNYSFTTKLITNQTYPAGTAKIAEINKTWIGSVDSLWTNGSNWSPQGVPTAGDNVLIPPGMPHQPIIFNMIPAVCNHIRVEVGGNLTVKTGGSLTIGQ